MASRQFEPTILLVEDDPLTRQQLTDLLKEQFPNLDVAVDGEQGLKLYQERKHDVVVTDILMPVMDGLDMADRIRKLNPSAQIVVITAYNEDSHAPDRRQVAVTYVLKPIDIDALVDTVNRCTEKILAERTERL